MNSMLKKLGRPSAWVLAYALCGGTLSASYAYAALTGWDWGSERGEIPSDVRNSQHGYRNYAYWHDHHHWHGPTFLFWSSSPYRGYRWGK